MTMLLLWQIEIFEEVIHDQCHGLKSTTSSKQMIIDRLRNRLYYNAYHLLYLLITELIFPLHHTLKTIATYFVGFVPIMHVFTNNEKRSHIVFINFEELILFSQGVNQYINTMHI
ncbi:hypothetical protein ACJX0J_005598 [Zea mays]